MFAPIRTKIDALQILLRSISVMLVNKNGSKVDSSIYGGKLILRVSKMSRLFFVSENKYYSLAFPFLVRINNNEFEFLSKSSFPIDNKLANDMLSIVLPEANEALTSGNVYDFFDSITAVVEYGSEFWAIMQGLFFGEEGYIRYDYDMDHVNGDIHPLNHLDVFYSNGVTFKVGLDNQIGHDALIDILNLETNCHFLSQR